MKKRILVGTRNGKAVINWPTVLVIGLLVGLVVGAAGTATWFLLTGEFSLSALLFPIPLGLGYFVGEAIRTRLSTPASRLTPLDGPESPVPRPH
ncbi:MAG: hypothetical protein U0793_05990 [Gemmataceae bacterium]